MKWLTVMCGSHFVKAGSIFLWNNQSCSRFISEHQHLSVLFHLHRTQKKQMLTEWSRFKLHEPQEDVQIIVNGKISIYFYLHMWSLCSEMGYFVSKWADYHFSFIHYFCLNTCSSYSKSDIFVWYCSDVYINLTQLFSCNLLLTCQICANRHLAALSSERVCMTAEYKSSVIYTSTSIQALIFLRFSYHIMKRYLSAHSYFSLVLNQHFGLA